MINPIGKAAMIDTVCRFAIELSEKINIVAEELRKGNSEIVKEFFDFLCIDISKKESGKK